jgi:spermidine/putrescine transport system substrate-binding protein
MRHPKERYPWQRGLSRREFLRRSAGTAFALSGGSALLAACGKASNPNAPQAVGSASASGGLALARRDNPVTWPIYPDNKPIASGLQPEDNATLRIFNWDQYLWKKVVNDFGKKYDCKVEISTFASVDEGLSKIRTGQVDYDVYFPDPSLLGKLVVSKLIRPLNLDYIPNLGNVWPNLQDPFYDQGSRYSVPYTIYSTGIGWRNDHVPDDIPSMSNPYDVYWDSSYKGKTYLLDDYRETIAMALLRRGITDVNTANPAQIAAAREDLQELVSKVAVKLDTSDFTDLPEGKSWIHQAWSGSLISAQYYLPKGTPVTTLSYWYPPEGGGVVGQDNITILATGKNPVLSHLFLNHMLDNKVAYDNFYNFNGYQPPMSDIDPARLVDDEAVPKNLVTAVVRPEDFDTGYTILELSPSVDALWHSAYQEFTAGV